MIFDIIIKKSDIMEITLLVKSILGLVVILGLLIFLLLLPFRKKQQKKKQTSKVHTTQKKQKEKPDLKSLHAVIKNKNSTEAELKEALELIIKYYGKVHKKLGLRAHPEFEIYRDILFKICRHPNTNKDLIVGFDRDLGRLNPEYKQEINEAITKGLNSRGM